MTNKKLESIYSKVPSFECIPGCSGCCGGPIPTSRAELLNQAEWLKTHKVECTPPSTNVMTCPWLVLGRCSIHPVRPLVCRLLGTSEDMKCPKVNLAYTQMLSRGESERMLWEVFSL